MKNKIYKYYIALFMIFISLVVAGIVFKLMPEKQEDPEEEILIETPIVKNQSARTYNMYTATVKFDEHLSKFFGNELIHYVHEFNQPTDTIFLTLSLNSYDDSLVESSDNGSEYLTKSAKDALVVKSVKIAGRQVQFHQSHTSVVIQLEERLDKNEAVDILIDFEGKVPFANDYVGRYKQNIWLKGFLPKIKVYSEQEGWMSEEDFGSQHYSYAEAAKYKVTVIVDERFEVITGTPFTHCINENGKKEFTFETSMVRDFGIYISPLKNKQEFKMQENKNLIIYSDDARHMQEIAERVDSLFGYYNNIFGTYPYDTFIIVDADTDFAVSYPKMLITNIRQKEDFMDNIGKNIGNQWVPYIIMHRPGEYEWLNEGLIEYMAMREKSSVLSIEKKLRAYQSQQEGQDKEVGLDVVERLLKMEKQLGENFFKERLRQYYKTYAFTIPTVQDFYDVMSQDNHKEHSEN